MTNRNGFKYVPGLVLATAVVATAVTSGGCSAANTLQQAAAGCDEFNNGGVASLQIDAKTKAFVQASADLVAVTNSMETSVLNACIAIDTDLGVADTWTAKSGTDDKVNEACGQAQTKIKAILDAQAQVQATCTLAISGGGCVVDVNAQADCTAKCSGDATCTPPDITVACEPGQLSGQCSGMCQASATCEGSVTAMANCQGSCEADCTGSCTPPTGAKVHCEGSCSGTCYGTCTANGVATPTGASGMANCAGSCSGQCDAQCTYTPAKPGHCEGSCKGTCTGSCKIDAMSTVMCGAMVNCKGGCDVKVTQPKCEGTVTPPMCSADVNCKASCQGHAEATAVCTKPTATFECTATAMADAQVRKLVLTLQTNVPALVAAVQTQGPLAVKAVGHVTSTGGAVVQAAGSLSGKALACATAAASASTKASFSVNVSIMASASVSGSCGGPTTAS